MGPPNGEGGIRTLDGGIHPHNALAGRRLQPLGHFSGTAMVSHGPARKSPFGGMLAFGRHRKMRVPVSPLNPPGICSARFLRQQEAGAFLFRRRLSRSAPRNAETNAMGFAAQPLSPELVLVCPELRAHALELLPARDPDALFHVAPRPAPKRVELRAVPKPLDIVPVVAFERRAARPVAVAAYVAEAIVLGALRGAAMIAAIAAAAFLLAR